MSNGIIKKIFDLLSGALVTDDLGRTSTRVIVNSEESTQLLSGRILLIQTEFEDLDTNDFIEIAVKSPVGPIAFLSLSVQAQMAEVSMDVLEGGVDLAGGAVASVINPNRLNQPTPNTEILQGTPANPITGTDGEAITPVGGWKLIGTEGFTDAQYLSASVDIGGFICLPDTWYQIRLSNQANPNNRPIQMSLKIIDPS